MPTPVVLKSGTKGDEVLALQQRLAELGYLTGTPDGVFGGATKKAVQEFQQTSGLTADGIAGAATLGAVYSEAAAAKPAAAATPRMQTENTASTAYVWITRTGTKYHRTDHCGNTKYATRVTLQYAIDMGYTPCGKCY